MQYTNSIRAWGENCLPADQAGALFERGNDMVRRLGKLGALGLLGRSTTPGMRGVSLGPIPDYRIASFDIDTFTSEYRRDDRLNHSFVVFSWRYASPQMLPSLSGEPGVAFVDSERLIINVRKGSYTSTDAAQFSPADQAPSDALGYVPSEIAGEAHDVLSTTAGMFVVAALDAWQRSSRD